MLCARELRAFSIARPRIDSDRERGSAVLDGSVRQKCGAILPFGGRDEEPEDHLQGGSVLNSWLLPDLRTDLQLRAPELPSHQIVERLQLLRIPQSNTPVASLNSEVSMSSGTSPSRLR